MYSISLKKMSYCCRRISNKTRIETSFKPELFFEIFNVAEGFPIKQGLKLHLHHALGLGLSVAEGFPIKQGLKLR